MKITLSRGLLCPSVLVWALAPAACSDDAETSTPDAAADGTHDTGLGPADGAHAGDANADAGASSDGTVALDAPTKNPDAGATSSDADGTVPPDATGDVRGSVSDSSVDGSVDSTALPDADDGSAGDADTRAPPDSAPGAGDSSGGDGGLVGPPASCPVGAPPGTPPSSACNGATPVLTSSGAYTFDLTGKTAQDNLGCTRNFSNPRVVTFAVCVPRTTKLALSFSANDSAGANAALAVSVRSDCTHSETCGTVTLPGTASMTITRLAPGTHYIAIEGYVDAAFTMNVNLLPFEELVSASVCSADGVDPILTADGPLSNLNRSYTFVPSGSAVSGQVPPTCGAATSPTVPPVDGTRVYPFSLSTASQVTIAQKDHAGATNGGATTVRRECGVAGTEAFCNPHDGSVSTALLQPGVYYALLEYLPLASMAVEPPPSTPNFTTCGTAIQVANANGIPPMRLTDDGTRFYRFTTTTSATLHPSVSITSDYGRVHVSVRSDCDVSAELANFDTVGNAITFGDTNVAGAPPGTYYLVAQGTPGSAYSIQVNW